MKALRKVLFIFVLSAFTILQSGCFGNFQLTRNVYNWNDSVTNSKFAKTLLFWGMSIIPVYGFAGFVDVIILNLIEFWTGSNPLAMAEGEIEYQIVEYEGELYKLTASKNKFTISKINGNSVEHLSTLIFNEDAQNMTIYTDDNELLYAYLPVK